MEHRQVQTEHRLVQLSKAVEEVLQETINLLGAAEDEDLQPSRQTFQQSRAHFDALLYTHRHANGATESLQMDLQQAMATLERLQAQGWQPTASSAAAAGVGPPAQHIKALEDYEAEMRACLINK